MQENRRHASRSRVIVHPPQTAKEIKNILAKALADIQSGRVEPKIGSVMAYMGSTLLKAIEITELEERLQALERLLKVYSGRFRS